MEAFNRGETFSVYAITFVSCSISEEDTQSLIKACRDSAREMKASSKKTKIVPPDFCSLHFNASEASMVRAKENGFRW